MVVTVDRGRYGCLVDPDGRRPKLVTAMRARELGRRAVAVGDEVELVGDTTGEADTLARIVRIGPRRSELRRSRDDTVEGEQPGSAASAGQSGQAGQSAQNPNGGGPSAPGAGERVLVANADQLVVVTALADPQPRTGFIDRCLVAAYTGGLRPLLVLTKADLADPAELTAAYTDLDLDIVVTRRVDGSRALTTESVEQVRSVLAGQMSVMIGHSGVGKSTLVNALIPDADRATGGVSGVGKGRHTSTSAVALRLPGGGWVVDTPGVRSFGLAHVTPDDLLATFDDLLPATVDCPPGCDHQPPEPGGTATGPVCALDAWVAAGHARPGRLESFRRLLTSRSGGMGNDDFS